MIWDLMTKNKKIDLEIKYCFYLKLNFIQYNQCYQKLLKLYLKMNHD